VLDQQHGLRPLRGTRIGIGLEQPPQRLRGCHTVYAHGATSSLLCASDQYFLSRCLPPRTFCKSA
jgi:hypothetical protein